ncbi:MFS transporter, partial [Streptomyces sp. T-3]|nr:MFS transporter [Streptomyces sp. T-3]
MNSTDTAPTGTLRTESGHRHRWAILAVLCLSLVVISIDTLILNLALPSIQTELGASGAQLQWTVDAYTLCFGGLLLLSGSLADRFGRRLTLTLGLVFFLGCSLAAAYADTSGALILARAGMGVGAAMIMPATLAIIKDVFPAGAERARAIGVWAAAAALGVPLGPVVGGLLLEHFWWGAIFLVNVPLVALALVAGMLLIPESRTARHPGLDLAGTLLSVAGLGVLVYGLVEASRDGWTGWTTLGPVAVGALLLVAFVRHERRTAHPMLAPVLWRSRAFTGSAAAIAALSFAMYGVLFVLTQYLQFVLAHDPLAAGLRLLPVAAVMLTAPLAPHLVQRLGLNTVVATGLALTAGALLL